MPMLLTKLMAAGLGSGLANAFCADTADSQTATGTNQATAFETSTAFVRFTTVASGTGCLLDNGARGDSQFIINAGANALSVYPHVGGSINGLGTNAAFSIPAGSWAAFDRYTDTLWTASNDAASSSFVQSGTTFPRSVQAKLREIEVNLADFGTLGNSSTGDDAVWQLALDYISDQPSASGVQGVLVLPRGATYLASPVHLGPNITIRGKGLRFATQIVPLATFAKGSVNALFAIDGADVTGGSNFYVNFENCLIDETNVTATICPVVFKLLNAYSCSFTDVYVHNGVGKIYTLTTCNDIEFLRPKIFGLNLTDCTHGIHAISASSATIISPDIEVCGAGIQQDADCSVTVIGGFGERCTRAWYNNGSSSGDMTVIGGLWQGVNGGTIAAEVKGGNCTVIGGRYTANGGSGLFVSTTRPANSRFHGVSGDVNDANNLVPKEIDETSGFHENSGWVPNVKLVADATATTCYTITVPNVSGVAGLCEVELFASLGEQSSYVEKYTIAFTQSGGTPTCSATPTAYAKNNNNASANYTLTLTPSAVVSGSTILVKFSADSGGAIGNGMNVTLRMKARIASSVSTGTCYITAN